MTVISSVFSSWGGGDVAATGDKHQPATRQRGFSDSDLSDSGSSWTSDDDDESRLLEMMESGFARESVTQECLKQEVETDKAEDQQFYVKRYGKDMFEMFSQHDDRFLLTAKRQGFDFTISPYRAAADDEETAPAANRTCAVLKKSKTGRASSYRLYLTGCEGCNRRREHYLPNEYPRNADGMSIDEQLLAEIRHSTTNLPELEDLLLRKVDVFLPGTLPSTGGSLTPQVSLCTKLPKFQSKTGCLVQKFNDNRVRASSAKNFMLVTNDKEADYMMQFGKESSKRYILDHSMALAPLQAFGICLSMCSWLGD